MTVTVGLLILVGWAIGFALVGLLVGRRRKGR